MPTNAITFNISPPFTKRTSRFLRVLPRDLRWIVWLLLGYGENL